MANYTISDNPTYDPNIRKLEDEDYASATDVFNPLFQQLIDNTQANYVESEKSANKGVSGGYASLDINGKVPLSQLSDTIVGQMVHAGYFDATTALATLTTNGQTILDVTTVTITLTNDSADITGYSDNQGNYFPVTVAGSFAGLNFAVGDWLVADASGWSKLDNSDAVTEVNGMTGSVTVTTISGNAGTATKLQTPRTFRVNLNTTSPIYFDGTADIRPGVQGTLPVANGGTGAATAGAALTNIGALSTTGDASNVTNTFTQAATRENLTTGEKLAVALGKIMKWFTDLKAIAFSGSAADITQSAAYRFVSDTEKATWNAKQNAMTVDVNLSETSKNPIQNQAVAVGIGLANFLINKKICRTNGTALNSTWFNDIFSFVDGVATYSLANISASLNVASFMASAFAIPVTAATVVVTSCSVSGTTLTVKVRSLTSNGSTAPTGDTNISVMLFFT